MILDKRFLFILFFVFLFFIFSFFLTDSSAFAFESLDDREQFEDINDLKADFGLDPLADCLLDFSNIKFNYYRGFNDVLLLDFEASIYSFFNGHSYDQVVIDYSSKSLYAVNSRNNDIFYFCIDNRFVDPSASYFVLHYNPLANNRNVYFYANDFSNKGSGIKLSDFSGVKYRFSDIGSLSSTATFNISVPNIYQVYTIENFRVHTNDFSGYQYFNRFEDVNLRTNTNNTNINFYVDSTSTNVCTNFDTNFYSLKTHYDIYNHKVTFNNGFSKGNFNHTFDGDVSFYRLNYAYNTSSGYLYNQGTDISYFSLASSKTLFHELFPVYLNTNDVPLYGLYDRVTNMFYYAYDGEPGEDPYINGDVLSFYQANKSKNIDVQNDIAFSSYFKSIWSICTDNKVPILNIPFSVFLLGIFCMSFVCVLIRRFFSGG